MCMHLSVCVCTLHVCAHLPVGVCVCWVEVPCSLGLSCCDHSPSESCRAPTHFQTRCLLQLDSADVGNSQNILPGSCALSSPQGCRAPAAAQGLPPPQNREDQFRWGHRLGGVPDGCKPQAHETRCSAPDLRTRGQTGQAWGLF